MVVPSFSSPSFYCSALHANFPGDLRNGFLCAVRKNYESVSAGVVCLLKLCCPAAIRRLVISVVVDSVDAVFIAWPWSHICIERNKAVLPPVAHSYSASAVTRIVSLFRNVATTLYLGPNRMFTALSKAVRFTPQAPAALCDPRTQGACKHKRSIAALTYAVPAQESAFLVAKLGDCKKSKFSSRQIMLFHEVPHGLG